MPTPSDPTGSPSSAKAAVPAPSSDATESKPPAKITPTDLTGELPIPVRSGSTDSHKPGTGNSDFILRGGGSSSRHKSPESDIAQFLAHPQGGAANTDDSPTVITQGNQANGANAQPTARPLPVIVTGEVPS